MKEFGEAEKKLMIPLEIVQRHISHIINSAFVEDDQGINITERGLYATVSD